MDVFPMLLGLYPTLTSVLNIISALLNSPPHTTQLTPYTSQPCCSTIPIETIRRMIPFLPTAVLHVMGERFPEVLPSDLPHMEPHHDTRSCSSPDSPPAYSIILAQPSLPHGQDLRALQCFIMQGQCLSRFNSRRSIE